MITISISLTVCKIQPLENLASLSLTFQGHPRSNFIAPNESPYMTSYTLIIETKSVSLTVFELFGKITPISLSMGVVNFDLCRGNYSTDHYDIQ